MITMGHMEKDGFVRHLAEFDRYMSMDYIMRSNTVNDF
jgi:hypothetical protein